MGSSSRSISLTMLGSATYYARASVDPHSGGGNPMRLRVFVALLAVAGTVGATPMERDSASRAGGEGSGDSMDPALSADGRYVAFTSRAPDLTADDGDTIEGEAQAARGRFVALPAADRADLLEFLGA